MNKYFCFLVFVSIFAVACSEKKDVVPTHDFQQISESKELNVIMISSSTSYFIYKDEPMGYDYDLVKSFCDNHGLKLNIKVAENPTRLLQMLADGEGDVVAATVPIMNELKDSIIYCGPEQISHQVLVQRIAPKDSMIRDVTQLIGKEVYTKSSTKYDQRLKNLDAELGNGIKIKDIAKDTVTVEDLIGMVANDEIDYTVADEYIAKLNKTYYRNIDVSLPISFEQRSSWAVRKNTPVLADSLNKWFDENKRKPTYRATIKKYFELSKLPPPDSTYLDAVESILYSKGEISIYDPLFKKYAPIAGYDWYLLAAIAYQESRFRIDLTSWAGAIGLMGLMPRTAAVYGVEGDDLKNPDRSVMASASYINYLDRLFKGIPDPNQRIKFVLASYNGGNGHIADARALARKYGDDPDIWDNSVEKYIELKSKPEFYNDSVVRFGYLRGTEVVNYVSQVTNNWHKYKINHKK